MTLSAEQVRPHDLVVALKAAAEPTRLRILLLLADAELNVKDLTKILGQSQPRISRHLKLLAEAGLIERFRDGSWAYFHVSDRSEGGRLTRKLLDTIDRADLQLMRDRERADALKRERERAAQTFFRDHAEAWDNIRSLHVSEQEVEAAMLTRSAPVPSSFCWTWERVQAASSNYSPAATSAGSVSISINQCLRTPKANSPMRA